MGSEGLVLYSSIYYDPLASKTIVWRRAALHGFARPRTDCVSILRLVSMLMAVQGLKHFDAANVLETVQYDVALLQYRADR